MSEDKIKDERLTRGGRPLKVDAAFKKAFVERLREGATIIGAAREMGVNVRTIYHHRDLDPEFAEDMASVDGEITQRVEKIALEEIFVNHNPRLIIFWLENHMPEVYGKNKQEPKQEVPPVQVVLGSKEEMYAAFFEALRDSNPDKAKAAAAKLKEGDNGAHA